MKFLKRAIPLPVVIALLSIVVVGAGIVASRTITTSISIVALMDLEVYDTDQTKILTSIDFGELHRNEEETYPSSGTYFIKNIGEDTIHVSWNDVDWPSSVIITVFVDGTIMSRDSDKVSINAGSSVTLTIKLDVSATAAFASYTPSLVFRGDDTA